MKKIFLIALFFSQLLLNGCGYTPLFSSKEINIKIEDYSFTGNQDLGNEIYSQLIQLVKPSENARMVNLTISTSQKKSTKSKTRTGKDTEYKITIDSEIKIVDYFSNDLLFNRKITLSESYKVQNQSSETEQSKKATIKNMIDRISQTFLFEISDKMSSL